MEQNKIDEHKQNWINHLDRMTDKPVLKWVLHKPKGQ
jgi:hypothetical protein